MTRRIEPPCETIDQKLIDLLEECIRRTRNVKDVARQCRLSRYTITKVRATKVGGRKVRDHLHMTFVEGWPAHS